MSASREDLHRILKAVIHDLEIDGYAREQIASVMVVRGLEQLFGEEKRDALNMLDDLLAAARQAVQNQIEEELLQ